MARKEQYNLEFYKMGPYEKIYFRCSTNKIEYKSLAKFLSYLDINLVKDLLQEIEEAQSLGNYKDTYIGDPWEEMNVEIDIDVFVIDDFRVSLLIVKELLIEWLEFMKS